MKINDCQFISDKDRVRKLKNFLDVRISNLSKEIAKGPHDGDPSGYCYLRGLLDAYSLVQKYIDYKR